jgi:triosephosphate isomerase
MGNWKMHMSLQEATGFVNQIKRDVQDVEGINYGICPPFVYLMDVADMLRDTPILLGAQNVHWEEKGAYTGEISALMLREAGCTHVIIGHSERRHIFGETDEWINKKIKAVLNVGLIPIFCVGELLEEREKGQTEQVLKRQVTNGLEDLSAEEIQKVVIAYEPVWAIGTGHTATPGQAQQAHAFIRELLHKMTSSRVSEEVVILYGGSVKPDNVAALVTQPDVDGALVGGASLKAKSFVQILRQSIPRS